MKHSFKVGDLVYWKPGDPDDFDTEEDDQIDMGWKEHPCKVIALYEGNILGIQMLSDYAGFKKGYVWPRVEEQFFLPFKKRSHVPKWF